MTTDPPDDDTIPVNEIGANLVRATLEQHGVHLEDRSWLQHACPFDGCHASVGSPCTTNGRDRTTAHPARLDAWRVDCDDPRCTRLAGKCVGMHCARCGEPCSSQGHRCAAQPPGSAAPHGSAPTETRTA